MIGNPYIVSNWVKDDHFYGREVLCQTLTATRERCVYLVGTRRIGKTSTCMRLTALLGSHAVYCDLMQAAGGEHLDQGRLVFLMRRALGKAAFHSEQLRASREVWDRNELSLCGWLEQVSWAWEDLGYRMTLIWDEAELLRRLPNSTLMPLRAILQHSNSVRTIVCASKGLAKIDDHWRDQHVSPFLFGWSTQYLSGLTDDEADALIGQRGHVTVTSRVADTIRAVTGNHPFLIQLLCSKLYANGRLREPTEHDLTVDATLGRLFDIDLDCLAPGERAVLVALAHHGPLRTREIVQHTGVDDNVFHALAAALLQLGLLRRVGTGHWQIGNAFLGQWLRRTDRPTMVVAGDQIRMEVDEGEGHVPSSNQDRFTSGSTTLPPIAFSARELEVLRLVAAGLSNPEIAQTLIISENTVKTHVQHIYRKLGVNDRIEALSEAQAQRLI